MVIDAPSFVVQDDQIDMVISITGCADRGLIKNALKQHRGDIGQVVNEYFDNEFEFSRKYGWDELAFGAGREGDDAPGANNSNIPSFSIHGPPILGTEPGPYYGSGAPSRPPSRVNNRSPMSRLVDAATAEFSSDTPTSHQEEQEQLQRAINASLEGSGIQPPLAFPPPPAPAPQQSGVINSESGVVFGPANRPDYEPDEWAMVRLSNRDSDADPTLRSRKPGAPVLLRCRLEPEWNKHRLGALLMIFQTIPAARNALLRTGDTPGYGYGTKSDWWQGQPITVPAQEPRDLIGDRERISWTDEIHRLIAFLEGTDRAYGTADLLTRAEYIEDKFTDNAEKTFFYAFHSANEEADPEILHAFVSHVEIGALSDLALQTTNSFGILDLQVRDDSELEVENLYHALDWMFFTEFRLAKEDQSTARTAWMSRVSDVFTCRLQGVNKLPHAVDIPETLYLDRYVKKNRREVRLLQLDMVEAMKAVDALRKKEEDLLRWVNPHTGKVYDDRRVLIAEGLKLCRERIQRIKRRAAWRDHCQGHKAPDDFYLADVVAEAPLLPDEAKVVADCEARIQELERQAAQIQECIDVRIAPLKEDLEKLRKAMCARFTDPEDSQERYRPVYKYTLRGVVDKENVVYQKLRVQEPGTEPTDGAEAAPAEKWWKTWLRADDNTVEHEIVTFETVKKETCSVGCEPILVYASEKAMQQEPIPLSDALRNFVRFDNRLFKQELVEASRTAAHKRSAGIGDVSQSKRLQRSISMDSMATNRASFGAGSDRDDDMRDAPPFPDNDSAFGGSETGLYEEFPELRRVHNHPSLPPRPASSPQPPSYDKVMEMESGVSPTLAHVSLQEIRNNRTRESAPSPKAIEMQERPNMQYFMRPPSRDVGTGGAGMAPPDDPPPLIDLNDGPETSGNQEAQSQGQAKPNNGI